MHKELIVERWILSWPVCMSTNASLSFPIILYRGTTRTDVQRRQWRRHFKTDPPRSDPRWKLRSLRPPCRRPRPWTAWPRPSAWGGGACRRRRRCWWSRQRRIAQQIPVQEEEKVSHPVVPKEKQKEVRSPVRKLYTFSLNRFLLVRCSHLVSIFLLKPHIVLFF